MNLFLYKIKKYILLFLQIITIENIKIKRALCNKNYFLPLRNSTLIVISFIFYFVHKYFPIKLTKPI